MVERRPTEQSEASTNTSHRSSKDRTIVRGHHIRSMLPAHLMNKSPEEAAKLTEGAYRVMAWVPVLDIIARDTIGSTRKQREQFKDGIKNTLTELAEVPDDHAVHITADGSKDGFCKSAAHGVHCGIKKYFHKDAGYLDIFAERAQELNTGDVTITSRDGIPEVLMTTAGTFRTVMDNILPNGATRSEARKFVKEVFKAESKYDKQQRKNRRARLKAKLQGKKELPSITHRTITKDETRESVVDTRSKPVALFLTTDVQSPSERSQSFADQLRSALETHPDQKVLVYVKNREWAEAMKKGKNRWRRHETPIAQVNDDHGDRIIWAGQEQSYRANTERALGLTVTLGKTLKDSTFKPHKFFSIKDHVIHAKYMVNAKAEGMQQSDTATRIASRLEDKGIGAAIVVQDMSQEDMRLHLEATGHDVTTIYPKGETPDGPRIPRVTLHQAIRAGEDVLLPSIKHAELAEARSVVGGGLLLEADRHLRKRGLGSLFYRGDRVAEKDRELREKMQKLMKKKEDRIIRPGPGAMHKDQKPEREQRIGGLTRDERATMSMEPDGAVRYMSDGEVRTFVVSPIDQVEQTQTPQQEVPGFSIDISRDDVAVQDLSWPGQGGDQHDEYERDEDHRWGRHDFDGR